MDTYLVSVSVGGADMILESALTIKPVALFIHHSPGGGVLP